MMLLIKNHWTVAILFGLMYIITSIYLPLINSALFAYEKEGVSINFGLARGCGSATYAILALVIGNLALNHGTNIIPIGGLIMIVLFLAIVIMMPTTKKVITKCFLCSSHTILWLHIFCKSCNHLAVIAPTLEMQCLSKQLWRYLFCLPFHI